MNGEQVFVQAQIGCGVFASERSFEVNVAGKIYSGIVDKDDVICAGSLESGKVIEGKIRVYEIEKAEDRVLIGFTRDAINGQRAWVPNAIVSYEQL